METRLICDGPADGVWNMAVDEALLESVLESVAAPGGIVALDAAMAKPTRPATPTGQPIGLPTASSLRFYLWSPATLSLGYFQGLSEREGHAASRGCAVVRRASGGGAILHDHELTYSFATAVANGLGGHEALYDAFHETLVETLAEWGVLATRVPASRIANAADAAADEPAKEAAFLCFERRSPGDVVVAGMKIGGSAQRRNRGALLQHGSVLLRRSPFAPELPGIAELTGVSIAPQALRDRWCERLASRLSLRWRPAALTPSERLRAESFGREKFGGDAWTGRRP